MQKIYAFLCSNICLLMLVPTCIANLSNIYESISGFMLEICCIETNVYCCSFTWCLFYLQIFCSNEYACMTSQCMHVCTYWICIYMHAFSHAYVSTSWHECTCILVNMCCSVVHTDGNIYRKRTVWESLSLKIIHRWQHQSIQCKSLRSILNFLG